MANALYPSAKKSLLDADIDLLADDIRVALVDTGTVSYNSAHDFVNDISAGIVARSGALQNKTTTAGTFDADDITINAVTGATVEAVAVYKYNASDSSAALVAWIDTAADNTTPLAFTPNGSNVTITFSGSGIFSI